MSSISTYDKCLALGCPRLINVSKHVYRLVRCSNQIIALYQCSNYFTTMCMLKHSCTIKSLPNHGLSNIVYCCCVLCFTRLCHINCVQANVYLNKKHGFDAGAVAPVYDFLFAARRSLVLGKFMLRTPDMRAHAHCTLAIALMAFFTIARSLRPALTGGVVFCHIASMQF